MVFSPPSLSVKVALPSVNVTACSPLPKVPETGSPSPSVSVTAKPNSRWLSPPTTVFLTVRLPVLAMLVKTAASTVRSAALPSSSVSCAILVLGDSLPAPSSVTVTVAR